MISPFQMRDCHINEHMISFRSYTSHILNWSLVSCAYFLSVFLWPLQISGSLKHQKGSSGSGLSVISKGVASVFKGIEAFHRYIACRLEFLSSPRLLLKY